MKYTNKLLSFLNNNFSKYYKEYKYDENEIVKSIINEYDNIRSSSINQLKIKNQQNINKIHTYNDMCLVQMIILELFNDKIVMYDDFFKITDDISFSKWYRMNHNQIDLKNILEKNRKNKIYNDYYNILFNPIKNRKDLHELLYENSFVSLDIIQHAESEDLIYQYYSGNNIDISLYLIDKNDAPNMDLISRIISLFRKIFKKNLSVNFIIFYGKQKKYLVSGDKYICSDNINSGSSIKGIVICIWRKEEFMKVLIHELIHYFGLDFHISDSIYDTIYSIFEKKIKIDGIDRVNESYTESLAILINSIIYSVENNINFNEIISHEILFSQYQIAKIMNHFECEKYDCTNTIFYQNTSTCSYHLIKTMFMMNYDKMLDYWKNKGYYILDNQESYIKLYEEIINSNIVDEDYINNAIQFIKNNNDGSFVYITMRMCLYSLQ